jgi:hypothetical protein
MDGGGGERRTDPVLPLKARNAASADFESQDGVESKRFGEPGIFSVFERFPQLQPHGPMT